ncbi:MAG TPA: hypothetical protein VMS76_19915 [Planctomycetota bacterium]|nr:hypothetical protein [Planctomycetota bacterium]
MNNEDLPPWAIEPSLQLHRLKVVASVFETVWSEVYDLHEPSKGDSNWSLGCRAYSRTCSRLSHAAREEHVDWLRILRDTGLEFLFAVGSVPFKFLRASPQRTVLRHRECGNPESDAREQLLLGSFALPEFANLLPRFLVETDGLSGVKNVVLGWVDANGNTHHPFDIPLSGSQKLVTPTPKPPTGPPAPVLGFDRDRKKKTDKKTED